MVLLRRKTGKERIMKAMNRVNRESKRKRDDDARDSETIMKTLSLMSKAIAYSLYKRYKFKLRSARALQDSFDLIDELTEQYGSENVGTELDKLLEECKIDITVKGR